MARKSRYLGYMKGLQKISKHERTSTKESLLDKLRSMKNRAVSYTHLTLPTNREV